MIKLFCIQKARAFASVDRLLGYGFEVLGFEEHRCQRLVHFVGYAVGHLSQRREFSCLDHLRSRQFQFPDFFIHQRLQLLSMGFELRFHPLAEQRISEYFADDAQSRHQFCRATSAFDATGKTGALPTRNLTQSMG